MAAAVELGGIYEGHLGHVERGEVNVSIALLVGLAKAYRVPLHEFFSQDVVLNPRPAVPEATKEKAPRNALRPKRSRRQQKAERGTRTAHTDAIGRRVEMLRTKSIEEPWRALNAFR